MMMKRTLLVALLLAAIFSGDLAAQSITVSPINPAPISAAIGSDTALGAASNFTDGPSIAQGTAGTWFVVGTATLFDTAGAAGFACKLWDGTTVISSGFSTSSGASATTSITLSGFLAAPAGNLKVTCADTTAGTGSFRFNASGSSRDSSITAFRIK